ALMAGLSGCSGPAPATPQAIRVALDDARDEEAERLARAWLLETEKRSGTDTLDTASAIDLLTEALQLRGKFAAPETLDLAKRALAIREKLAPDAADTAASVDLLSMTLRRRGKWKESLALDERSLAIRKAALG